MAKFKARLQQMGRAHKKHPKTVGRDTQDVAAGELSDLLDVDHGLDDWELGFIESINKRIEGGRPLSVGQVSKLHKTWDKHCGR